jgi:hypothetical protein
MTTRTQVTSLFQKFAGQSATLVIPRPYIDFCEGDHLAALLFSQMLYWSERTDDPDGWFAKSYEDWYEEIGLTERQIKRIVSGDKRRKEDGFSLESVGIETKLARSDYYKGAATLHYRVNREKLEGKINAFSQVPTIARNDQCSDPTNGQNDDPTNGQNDHIHRLDHKEEPTADAVVPFDEMMAELDITQADLDATTPLDAIIPDPDPVPDDFKAIQEHTVNVVFGGNAAMFGKAGDIANWALRRNDKVQWAEWKPDKAFSRGEWKMFCLWYSEKRIAWPSNAMKWNKQAYEFRQENKPPRTAQQSPFTAEDLAAFRTELMTPFGTGDHS